MSEEELQGLKYRRMRELNKQASKACRAQRQEQETLYTCSQSSIKEQKVTEAGSCCFLLFNEENYADFIHKVGWATPLKGLGEIGVKSVKFIQEDCSHFSMDRDRSVTIVISVCVVVVVILAILGFSLFYIQRQKRGTSSRRWRRSWWWSRRRT